MTPNQTPGSEAPTQHGQRKIRTVLVCIDDSDHARHAAELASEIAATNGAHLLLLHVADTDDSGQAASLAYRCPQPVEEWFREEADELLSPLELEAQQGGVAEVDKIIEFGDPARTIADVAEANDVDLIVLGRTGFGPLASILVESVTCRVAQLSQRPVLTTV